jgi:hypothetical protein
VGGVQGPQQFHDLRWCLARAVDDLGVAGTFQPVGVEPRVPEVVNARLRALIRQMSHAANLRCLGARCRIHPDSCTLCDRLNTQA